MTNGNGIDISALNAAARRKALVAISLLSRATAARKAGDLRTAREHLEGARDFLAQAHRECRG